MPDWTKYIRTHLPLDRFRGEMEGEILDELAAHLEDAYQEAVAGGSSPAEAEAKAVAEIGDWEDLASRILRSREGARNPRVEQAMDDSESRLRAKGGGWIPLADFIQECRFTFRRLRRTPGFSVIVLLTLAVGIGSTTAIFSVVKDVLLDPLPYEDAHRLVSVWNSAPGMGEDRLPQSLAFNAVHEDEIGVFEEVGLWFPNTQRINIDGQPEEISSIAVTDGTLRALRVQPAMGRLFDREDTQNGSPTTVILSHRYWQEKFGGAPEILGRTLEVGGSQDEIIGVMPPGFRLMDRDPDVYQPLYHNRAQLTVSNFIFHSLGRLRDGVTIEAALSEMARAIQLAPERYPGGMTLEQLEGARGAPGLNPLRDDLVGGVDRILWVVLGGVGIILLVAVANVANLFLIRTESRERDRAIQAAMGSPMRRVLGELLLETGILAVAGGAMGVALAHVSLSLLRSLGPGSLPRLAEIGLDGGTLAFTLGVSVLVALGLAVLPLLRARTLNLVGALKEGGRGSSAGRRGNRTRNVLVVGQLALALILLTGSGLMVRSFISLSRAEPGFSDPEELLTFRFLVGSLSVPDAEEVPEAHAQLAQRISEIPGVTSVGLSTSVAMTGNFSFDPIWFEDFPLPEGQSPRIRRFKRVGGNYPETMGNPIVAGRSINWDDIRNRTRVVMITEGMAREAWGDPQRAVGRRIGTGPEPGNWREIVGVVGDVRDDGMEHPPVDIVYWPMVIEDYWDGSLFVARTMGYVVRSPRAGTTRFLSEIQGVFREAYPTRPLRAVTTMDEVLRDSTARTSFTLVMLGIAAAVALLLGSIGIYGVISYAVGQRTQELGLRIAMGAEAGSVVGMVLRQGLVLATLGVTLGVAGAIGTTRLMSVILHGVSPVDPLTYSLVAMALLGVTLLASYAPARRASRVDPMVALRAE